MINIRKKKKPEPKPISGWLVVDKPLGVTSTQVVGKVRYAFGVKKVGHAGTLDPLASGVIPIAIGEATKTVPYVQDYKKNYEFRIQWGENRNTDDAEGEIIATSDKRPSLADIKEALPTFTGEIEQVPPKFSAIKVDGKRAYALSRQGEDVKLKARPVTIYSLTILDHDEQWVDMRMECSKGTYVRSIGRDLAAHLGTCGYISKLRRINVGVFNLNDAILLDFLAENAKTPIIEEYLLPIETALDDIPVLSINHTEASTLSHGQRIRLFAQHDLDRLTNAGIKFNKDQEVTVLAKTSKPIGLVTVKGAEISPSRMFNL